MCDIVSDPDPVESRYAAELGDRIEKDAAGRPFGEMLI